MKIIGIGAGRPRGNTEIFVKEALMAAEQKGCEVEYIRLSECNLHNCSNCSINFCPSFQDPTKCPYGKDDAAWIIDRFLDADGCIFGSSCFSLTPNSLFFTFRDRVFGPKMDIAIPMMNLFPEPEFIGGRLHARPGALISVGGALTEHWTALNLPAMYSSTFSAQIEVVDTLNVYGVADPDAAAGYPEWLAKAHKLGERVAEAAISGDHSWRGDKPGTCPTCHLDMVQLVPGTDQVICPVCGIYGKICVSDGVVSVEWPDDREHRKDCRMTVEGKLVHQEEIRTCMHEHYFPRKEELHQLAKKYHAWDDCRLKPPSKTSKIK